MSRLLKYWELPIVMGVNDYDCVWLIKEEFKDKINSGEFQREMKRDSNIKVTATCNIIKP